MRYISKRTQLTQEMVKALAIITFILALVIIIMLVDDFLNLNTDIYITGTFQDYTITTVPPPLPSRFNSEYQLYHIIIDSKAYSISNPVYPYFSEYEFLEDVRVGDTVVLALNHEYGIIGVETERKIYLSISDAKKAIMKDQIIGWILVGVFLGMAILLYTNRKKFPSKKDFQTIRLA